MNTQEARQLGETLAFLIDSGEIDKAYDILTPVLAERIPFRLLDRIGHALGSSSRESVNLFLERIAKKKTEGGWVVIASSLRQQLHLDPKSAFSHSQSYIIAADIWYAADIFGERVPGPALVDNFQTSINLLSPWREHENRWVRRTIGVAVHFWAKRSRGAPELTNEAEKLLILLEPMFTEWQMDAVKGVGWGLKTLGRYYPELVVNWLPNQIIRPHRAIMLRKAMTFLTPEQRTQVMGETR